MWLRCRSGRRSGARGRRFEGLLQGGQRMSRKTRRNAFRKAARGAAQGRLSIPGFVLGSVAISGTLFAAEPADTPPPPTSAAEQPLQEVVVTGIRASLQKS